MKAIIIGSGLAGLACAIRLRKAGWDVDVYESQATPGGKLQTKWIGDYRFDLGPSVLTKPEFIQQLFELCGENADIHFRVKKPEKIFQYFFEDGTILQTYNDRYKTAESLSKSLGIDKNQLLAYLQRSEDIARITSPVFLERSLHQLKNYFNKETTYGILHFGKIKAFQSLNQYHLSSFQNPKLVQLFNQYASYNGSNPYVAPGTLSVIPHFELNEGMYIPENGIHAIVDSLYNLALRQGVKFHFNKKVSEIFVHERKAKGIRISEGKVLGDAIISNADAWNTWKHLLPKEKFPSNIQKHQRSSSMVVFYWGVNRNFPELNLHNMFFSGNSQEEYRHIFDLGQVYNDPSVYVNITSKEIKGDAPEGKENWFVMTTVPHLNGQDWDELLKNIRRNVLSKLNRMLKTDLEPLIEVEEHLEPRIIESRYNSAFGSVYGYSSNSIWSAFLRQANFEKSIKGLYFCGGSAHPGAGMPLCLLSGKIAAELVQEKSG
ncbi:MAG: phytoene desaturase [Bacteroidia bacterium]|nr:phytoene desaturase [Bacteroidia bacterium]